MKHYMQNLQIKPKYTLEMFIVRSTRMFYIFTLEGLMILTVYSANF